MAASRRLYVDEHPDLAKILIKVKLSKSNKNNSYCSERYQKWFVNQVHEEGKRFYWDVVLIGAVKAFKADIPLPRKLVDFLRHKKSVKSMLQRGVTRQHLRDISDIFILDYLNLNIDRRDIKNWVRSETRLIAFDNGLSYRDLGPPKRCPRMLHCPAFLCGHKHPLCSKKKPPINCRFHAQTIHSLYNLDPRYQKANEGNKSVQMKGILGNLLGMLHNESRDNEGGAKTTTMATRNLPTSTLGEILRGALKTELIPTNYERYFGVYDLYKALDARVSYLLEFVEGCHDHFGDDVFI